MTTISDIIIGPVRTLYAPLGEAEPDPSSVEYGDTWGGNWVELGYTSAALTMVVDRTTYEPRSQQATLPLKRVVTEESVGFETVLMEVTATNLQLTLGGTVTTTPAGVGQVGVEDLEGGDEFELDERIWGFEGLYKTAAGVLFPVRVFVPVATSIINGNLEWAKETEVGIPLRVDALQPSGSTKPWHIQRVTAAATS